MASAVLFANTWLQVTTSHRLPGRTGGSFTHQQLHAYAEMRCSTNPVQEAFYTVCAAAVLKVL